MQQRSRPAELSLVPPLDPGAAPEGEREGDLANPAPKRMVKRCRRCGKPVPTLGGLLWRARRVAADLEAAAGQVFRARVEKADADAREELLRSAHQSQQGSRENAQVLLADLRRLQAHDRRCGSGPAAARGPGDAGPGAAQR